MRVLAFKASEAARISYVVWCEATRGAAVVDLDPASRASVKRAIERNGLRVELLLCTGPSVGAAPTSSSDPMSGLLAELASLLEDRDAAREDCTEERPDLAPEAIWVRPVVRRRSSTLTNNVEALTLVRANTRTAVLRSVRPGSPEAIPCDWRPGAASPPAGGYGLLQLSVGRLQIVAFPVGGQGHRLAFLVNDAELFTGRALITGSPRWVTRTTDVELLGLPDAVIVRPGEAGPGGAESTIAAERAAAQSRGLLDSDDDGWAALLPSAPRAAVEHGRPTVGGYRDVEPGEVLPVLATLHVLEVRVPRDDDPSIPGSLWVSPTGWAPVVESWDRNTPILVASPAGLRCASLAIALVNAGFKRVHRLVGGLALWVDSDLPVEEASDRLQESSNHRLQA